MILRLQSHIGKCWGVRKIELNLRYFKFEIIDHAATTSNILRDVGDIRLGILSWVIDLSISDKDESERGKFTKRNVTYFLPSILYIFLFYPENSSR